MKRNKLYTRREPDKEGKLYFIFCEGEKKETTYFYFFNRIVSQIIIQIVPIEDGKNSPMGLYNNAHSKLIKTDSNPSPSYDLSENDEVWFIIDTDKWGAEIDALRSNTKNHTNWNVCQSNPSFEVWLYYHFHNVKPNVQIDNWKEHLNGMVLGGFNPNKHPVYIERAISNSEINFSVTEEVPDPNTTELFILGSRILPLFKQDIELLLGNME
jgi:hypothetical protein